MIRRRREDKRIFLMVMEENKRKVMGEVKQTKCGGIGCRGERRENKRMLYAWSWW